MTISVSSRTTNSITVSCTYPVLTQHWNEGTPPQTKTATVSFNVQISWSWIWNGSSWLTNGWGHNTFSTYNYSDSDGYSNPSLPRMGVEPGTRPATPTWSGTTVNQTTTIFANTGLVTYSGTVTKPGGTGYYTYSGADISSTLMRRSPGSFNASGSSSNSFSYTFSGLTPSTTYNLWVDWYGNYGTGSGFVTSQTTSGTTADGPPPDTTGPEITYTTSKTHSSITVNANATDPSGVFAINIEINGQEFLSDLGSTSFSKTVSGLSANTSYACTIKAWDQTPNLNQSTVSFNVTTDQGGDGSPPTAQITSVSSTHNSITASVVASDNVGINRIEWYLNDYLWAFNTNQTSGTYTYTGLTPDTFYKVSARARDTSNTWSNWAETGIVTKKAATRPSNFSWQYSTISSGQKAVIDSRDWNTLTSRINAFRVYKGLESYTFTSAPYLDGKFYAFMFNQAVSAISQMSPPTSPPSAKNAGDVIYASYLNGLVTSLNSIL